MSEMKDSISKQAQAQAQSKTCFIIMPISDTEGYETSHFDRVYNYIIKPACEKAGFSANRADKTSKTNYIVIDILKQIINSDMAICDLSSRNSNVFFELGLRQAFNLKTVLIKDKKTPRSFDIAGFRCIDYDENLRVDNVEKIVDQVANALKDTMDSKNEEVNSLIQLLAVDAAKLPKKVTLTNDTGIILNEIQRLRSDVNHLYSDRMLRKLYFLNKNNSGTFILPNGEQAELYSNLYQKNRDMPFYEYYGKLIDRKNNLTYIERKDGILIIKDDDLRWRDLTIQESDFVK